MSLRMLSKTPSHGRFGVFASPWLLIGAAVILAVVVSSLALVNLNREKRYMSAILAEKGAALIRAVEAGTRTGMRGFFGSVRLQALVEETAGQADIHFIAITDATGRILVHSDRDRVGSMLTDAHGIEALAPADTLQWRLVERPEAPPSFTVYRAFHPMPPDPLHGPAFRRHPGRRPPGPRFMPPATAPPPGMAFQSDSAPPPGSAPPADGIPPSDSAPPPASPEPTGAPDAHPPPEGAPGDFFCSELCAPDGVPIRLGKTPLFIYIGMSVEPFEAARAQDMRTTLVISALLLLLGFGGVVSLFWAHNYRISRQLLLDTRAFASEVVASLPVGLVVTDSDNRIAFLNAAAEDIAATPLGTVAGQPAGTLLPPELLELARQGRKGPSVLEREIECRFAGRPPVPLSVSAAGIATEEGSFVGNLFILRDLREVRQLQAQVQRAERLAAVGDLAAGVAHEIRNPLSSIKGYAAYFGAKFSQGSEEHQAARVLGREADRLNRAVSELLEFARPSDCRPTATDMPDLLEHTLRLVRQDAALHNVETALDVEPGLPPVLLDPDRFAQALLNLYLNAIQSMRANGGTLRVRAALDESRQRVLVDVEDQGEGIEPANLDRIFDPYYTTKNQGTGLGLAIVHKIVEAHSGEMDVRSTPGQGSRFRIALPVGTTQEG